MDLILFKIIILTASVTAKCLYKNPSGREREREVQNAKLRMVWNIPLIFSPSLQPAEFMAFDDDCYTQGKKGSSSTHTVTYKLSVIKLPKYHDSI